MTTATLTAAFFVVALLFSSVGHAGATGYLAVMALVGVEPQLMRPTALSLNIVVAVIGTWQFTRAGYFRWKLFWPFAVTSIPAAYLGGQVVLPSSVYKPVVGAVLIVSAIRFLATARYADQDKIVPPQLLPRLLIGGALGFAAGLTGIGGGVFLSPLMLWFRWGETREVSAVAASFILVNSIAGLAGNWTATQYLPPQILLWVGAVVVGGALGSHLGSRRLGTPVLRRLLAIVLILSGVKLIAGV